MEHDNHFLVSAINAQATSSSWVGWFDYKDVRSAARTFSSNVKADSQLWTGVSTNPFYLASPLVAQAKNNIGLDLTDQSGVANVVHFCFVGARLPKAA